MRAFLLFLFTSILTLTTHISYSQSEEEFEEECANEIPGFFTEEQEAAIRDINIKVTKLLRAKRARSVEDQDYYIPVVINLIVPPNPPPHGTSSGYDIMSEDHALWFIDKLNETYNTSYGHYDNNQVPIPGFQEDSARINFIPATRDINNVPGFQWFRVFNLEDIEDQIPPLTNTCDPNNPEPYFESETVYAGQTTPIWIPYVGPSSYYEGHNVIVWSSSSCLDSRISHSEYLQSLLAYEETEYLNINVVFGIIGSIAGFASLPNTGDFRCFFRSSVYSTYGATAPHEVGHFLGLSHTFQGNLTCLNALDEYTIAGACEVLGDQVCDTYPTKKDDHDCYSGDVNDHCNVYEELIPTEHFNIMDYTWYCTHENFTPGQFERMRGFLELSDRSPLAIRGLYQLDATELCGDTEACNYTSVAPVDYNPDNCNYFDAVGICGGSCTLDVDSDGVCDDIDGCIDIDGTLDVNNNGICDEDDPCGSLTEIDGIFNDNGVQAPVPVIAIGNRCWSTMNSRVSAFSDGSTIQYINARDGIVDYAQDGLPARAKPNYLGRNPDEPNTSFVYNQSNFMNLTQYNWYAVTDPRGICPSGWHVSTDDDWIDLERAIGYQENEILRPLRKNNIVPSNYLINDLKFFNTRVDNSTNEIVESSYPYPSGYIDKYGIPREHAKQEFIWTTDEYFSNYNSRKNNVYYRRIETPKRWLPISSNPYSGSSSDWFDISINREYMLNSTSGSKFAMMSVRCVKDID